MAFRPLLRQRAVPAMTALVGSSMALYMAPRDLHAEEPVVDLTRQPINRKPIYDDVPLSTNSPADLPPAPKAATTTTTETAVVPSINPLGTPVPVQSTTTTPSTHEQSYRPTPTDRLAVHIGLARVALYQQAARAEDALNSGLTRTLALEHSFTSTIRSLAPSKESGEQLFPGALYVLVSGMAGSIMTRNRNILLRTSVPVAIGLGAAYAILPVTMQNVGDLAWKYESRYPVLADAHLRTKARVARFLETGRAHAQGSVYMVEEKVAGVRERVEDWVKKGK